LLFVSHEKKTESFSFKLQTFMSSLIAFSEIFITYAYKRFLAYLLPESLEPNSLIQLLSTDYKFAVSFSILVIVLLFRPSGIFKGRVL